MSLGTNPVITKDSTIVLSDGTGTPVTLTVPCDNGNLKISKFAQGDQEVQAFKYRGVTRALRKIGDIEGYDISFDCDLVGLTDAATGNVLDWFRKTGVYASNTSTLPASAGDVHTSKLKFTVEGTDRGASADGNVEFSYFHGSAEIEEGIPTKLKISGKAYIIAGTGATFT